MTEQVMVVERERLAPFLVEYGLVRERLDEALDVILDGHFFLDRPTAEVSPQYKQIIPYVLIRHDGSYFLLQRTQKQTEARLHHKLSLGIGGHINPDTPPNRLDGLIHGLMKELEEEVNVEGDYDLTFVGILNDDTTDVGSVHLGAVYVLDAHDANVTVRETEKMTGRWAPLAELSSLREQMETWSQIVYDEFVV
ncbi:MAG TPA: NUDIX domain-containing protein [Thermoanaerobaculia bacterium]|jgi:predicted NUDIX family phosphoesterase|nr:NUDIX domain-containing protein [Thermoanaerobaculia bacterium]